mgnify:CR=1 FL=1
MIGFMRVHKILLLLTLGWLPLKATADYSDHPSSEALINRVAERGVDRNWLKSALSEAMRQESILKAISRPAEKSKPWSEYQDIFLTDRRAKEGIKFWREHRETLDRVSQDTGVPSEVIVAIIGIETYYGRITGGYRVIDALSTLAFDYPRRSTFFTKDFVRAFIARHGYGVCRGLCLDDSLSCNGGRLIILCRRWASDTTHERQQRKQRDCAYHSIWALSV